MNHDAPLLEPRKVGIYSRPKRADLPRATWVWIITALAAVAWGAYFWLN